MYSVFRRLNDLDAQGNIKVNYKQTGFVLNQRTNLKFTKQPVDSLFGRSPWGMRTRNTNVPPPSRLQPPPSKSRTSALNGLVCSSIEMHTLVPRKGEEKHHHLTRHEANFSLIHLTDPPPSKKHQPFSPSQFLFHRASDHQPTPLLSNPISLSETSPPRRSHHPPATGMNPLSILHFKPLYPQQLRCPRLDRNIILSFSSPSSFRMGGRRREEDSDISSLSTATIKP